MNTPQFVVYDTTNKRESGLPQLTRKAALQAFRNAVNDPRAVLGAGFEIREAHPNTPKTERE